MRATANISKIFPKHLFWDVNLSKLDVQEDKDLIIPRALFATTENTFENDIKRLESLYHYTEIVKELQSTTERISNTVCKLVAQRYHIKHFSRF